MALLGAEVLAPFVTQALAVGSADRSLQRAYDAAWHRRFDRRIDLCRLFHHLLVNPHLIDLGSTFPALASRLLTFCFHQTRDPAKIECEAPGRRDGATGSLRGLACVLLLNAPRITTRPGRSTMGAGRTPRTRRLDEPPAGRRPGRPVRAAASGEVLPVRDERRPPPGRRPDDPRLPFRRPAPLGAPGGCARAERARGRPLGPRGHVLERPVLHGRQLRRRGPPGACALGGDGRPPGGAVPAREAPERPLRALLDRRLLAARRRRPALPLPLPRLHDGRRASPRHGDRRAADARPA